MKKYVKLFVLMFVFLLGMNCSVYAAEKEAKVEVIEPTGLQTEPKVKGKAEKPKKSTVLLSENLTEEEILFECEKRVKEGILAGKTEIDLTDLQNSDGTFPIGYYDLLYFSPYISNGIDYRVYLGSSVTLKITNNMSLEETKAYFALVDKKVNEVSKLTSGTMSDEQKALIVHDYLIYECAYDYDNYLEGTIPDDSYRSGGLLMNGTGVCQAYAYTFKYILNLAGVECHVTSSSEIKHAWNIVKIDGEYYHVDCTWDDPVYDKIGCVEHGFFLVSDEAIQTARNGGTKVHSGWNLTNLVCSSKKYDTVYWEKIKSQIITYEGFQYYIEGLAIFKRNLDTQEVIQLKNLGRWYVWNSTNSYYAESYSGLFLYQNELYYNTSKEIRKISLDGSKDTLVYQADISNGYIYGNRKHGDKLQYVIKQKPSSSSAETIFTAPVIFAIELTDVTLDRTEIELETGEEIILHVTLLPENVETDIVWQSDNTDVATVDKDGRVTALSAGTAQITASAENGLKDQCTVIVVKKEDKLPFTDVPEDKWYYEAIKYVYMNNIMSGLTDSLFSPEEKLTRAQFAVTLYRMTGSPKVEYTNKFSDVLDDQWYTEGVLWASETGIVRGYEDGSFGTNDLITREQMAVMVYRYADYMKYDISQTGDLGAFDDEASISAFAVDAMKWAVGAGLITGKDDGTKIDPQGTATRAECAAIITRFMKQYT